MTLTSPSCSPTSPILQQVIDRIRGWKATSLETESALAQTMSRVFGDAPPQAASVGTAIPGESFETVFSNLASEVDELIYGVERLARQLNNRV